ncbi:MAG: hypothetical protein LBI16_05480 [Burkholderiales bacterium]|nr:hypothetical protein [Burkholderiales bacterium]
MTVPSRGLRGKPRAVSVAARTLAVSRSPTTEKVRRSRAEVRAKAVSASSRHGFAAAPG